MRESQAFYCGVQCLVKKDPKGRAIGATRVLLGRRYRAAGEGQWALPGGHVEHNETPLVTARRELLEESGLVGGEARIGGTFFTYTTEIPYAHVPVLFSHTEGTAQLMPDERFSDLGYFRLDDLPQPMFEPSRIAIDSLLGGPLSTSIGGGSGVSFFKVDMVSIDVDENRNRAFTAFFLCDRGKVLLAVTWGRREYRGRSVRRETFKSVDEGARRLEELVSRRIKHRYYVTGASGDLALDRVLNIFPEAGSLRVVSDVLLRRLLHDHEFRKIFAQDVYLYTPELNNFARDHDYLQGTLF
jgi:8-oxo-dGTP diphosphatase